MAQGVISHSVTMDTFKYQETLSGSPPPPATVISLNLTRRLVRGCEGDARPPSLTACMSCGGRLPLLDMRQLIYVGDDPWRVVLYHLYSYHSSATCSPRRESAGWMCWADVCLSVWLYEEHWSESVTQDIRDSPVRCSVLSAPMTRCFRRQKDATIIRCGWCERERKKNRKKGKSYCLKKWCLHASYIHLVREFFWDFLRFNR